MAIFEFVRTTFLAGVKVGANLTSFSTMRKSSERATLRRHISAKDRASSNLAGLFPRVSTPQL